MKTANNNTTIVGKDKDKGSRGAPTDTIKKKRSDLIEPALGLTPKKKGKK